VWRNNTAQAWGTHTAGDLVARGNVRRSLANTSSLLADASQASIAELKAQWWQSEIPNYLQWSVDIGGIETTYTNNTTANILLRTTGVKNAGVTYASTVGTAIKDYETTTATAREQYLSTLMSIGETAAEATMRADRDKEIALADADLQKQLTGNESAHTTAVNNSNSAHSTATANAESARKSAEQAALTQLNSSLAQATKDKEASIAGAERTYDQTVASLDAQYGSESSNGDTGVEGATRRSAIATRDAQYYAARDTSWANTLSGSTTLGTSPWTLKAITAANAQAAYSTSRASAQAAHDAAMLDAIEDWQFSSRESLTDLLFTEGQSRETFNVATSNVYANWENGVGNLLGDKPEGTGYVPVRGFGENGDEIAGERPGRGRANFEEGTNSGQESGRPAASDQSNLPARPDIDAPSKPGYTSEQLRTKPFRVGPSPSRGVYTRGSDGFIRFTFDEGRINKLLGLNGKTVIFGADGNIAVNGLPREWYYQGDPARFTVKVDFIDGSKGDFDRANAKMRQVDPDWKQPLDYTWNHVGPKGSTELELVKTEFHERISHRGPAAPFRAIGNALGKALKAQGRAGAVFLAFDIIMMGQNGGVLEIEEGPFIFGDQVSGEYVVHSKVRTWSEFYNNRPLHYALTGDGTYVPRVEYQLLYLSPDRSSIIAVESITYQEYLDHWDLYYRTQGRIVTLGGVPWYFREGTERKRITIWRDGLFDRKSPVGWIDGDGVHYYDDEGFFDFLDEMNERGRTA
jgi:hypothetical protein